MMKKLKVANLVGLSFQELVLATLCVACPLEILLPLGLRVAPLLLLGPRVAPLLPLGPRVAPLLKRIYLSKG